MARAWQVLAGPSGRLGGGVGLGKFKRTLKSESGLLQIVGISLSVSVQVHGSCASR
jgi:hypothetical protein